MTARKCNLCGKEFDSADGLNCTCTQETVQCV